MVVKIMAVVLQWMESRHTSQTDSVGLGNGLDIGVRESEESKKKKIPTFLARAITEMGTNGF